jgi:hypothetical protein
MDKLGFLTQKLFILAWRFTAIITALGQLRRTPAVPGHPEPHVRSSQINEQKK